MSAIILASASSVLGASLMVPTTIFDDNAAVSCYLSGDRSVTVFNLSRRKDAAISSGVNHVHEARSRD